MPLCLTLASFNPNPIQKQANSHINNDKDFSMGEKICTCISLTDKCKTT